ncbi:hypothetical protein CIHG_00395 [Coccidioides immitis H538.4]|uniref:Uncharacterized protein n=3 Tax=Coccidioides immitis TaxID=5501 RepID=A0A0J8QHP9_COCIT|nr:hypothetical protein CIRG_07213 [Coccidioides immitis RMSCC 2394]KMU72016.1 hypothetical protein CISG_00325 [Coccidioides immitis RMSCC 3703]KMU82614.1 hypothetical protein CIHG_00395 [Coccidioides immitis H538.4]
MGETKKNMGFPSASSWVSYENVAGFTCELLWNILATGRGVCKAKGATGLLGSSVGLHRSLEMRTWRRMERLIFTSHQRMGLLTISQGLGRTVERKSAGSDKDPVIAFRCLLRTRPPDRL